MPSPTSQRFGPVVATRYRDGTCAAACHRADCRAYAEPRGWRRAVRLARGHAAAHAATDTRYVDTPWGTPAHEPPQQEATAATGRRRRRAAASRAGLRRHGQQRRRSGRLDAGPPTTTPAPSEYIPVPAGPPSSSNPGGDR
jgi:hypothetical protein